MTKDLCQAMIFSGSGEPKCFIKRRSGGGGRQGRQPKVTFKFYLYFLVKPSIINLFVLSGNWVGRLDCFNHNSALFARNRS
jgi:hypothetical protein